MKRLHNRNVVGDNQNVPHPRIHRIRGPDRPYSNLTQCFCFQEKVAYLPNVQRTVFHLGNSARPSLHAASVLYRSYERRCLDRSLGIFLMEVFVM